MVIKDVKTMMARPAEEWMPYFKVDQNTLPGLTELDDKFVVDVDCMIRNMPKRIVIDTVFVLECEKDTGLNDKHFNFRIASLDLRRARTVEPSSTLKGIPLRQGQPEKTPSDLTR